MKVIKDNKTGVLCRPNTYDLEVVREQSSYTRILKEANIVLDIGGNIGAFANRAFTSGATKVYSYEPDPDNFRMLRANKFSESHYIYNKAVGPYNQGRVPFYKNNGTNKGAHSLLEKRGREKIEVDMVDIRGVMKQDNFDTVKIDIEGFEYTLLEGYTFPLGVDYLAIEFHFGFQGATMGATKVFNSLMEQGFKTIKKPNLEKTSWADLGLFYR